MNGQNGGSFDANEILADGVITNSVVRHLNDESDQEDHEERVLNGPLTSVCTYPEDYKERQSLYSCLTCQQETGEFAGVCFACSENCHGDHDVIQLYTKRAFCCDCGNSKFKQKCKLFEEKTSVNRKNRYNHNFKDEYCTCNLPYPAPEGDPMHDADMVQCIMCEDWFHYVHIGLKEKSSEETSNEEYNEEVICFACSQKYPFIIPYHYICEQEEKRHTDLNATSSTTQANETNLNNTDVTTTDANQTSDYYVSRKPPLENNSSNDDKNGCYYEKIKSEVPDLTTARSLVFHNIDWRPMLCRCSKCMKMYEELECEFLLDEKDCVYHYLSQNAKEIEKTRRNPETELYEEIALRTNAQVAHNAVAEIAIFKRHLHEFLQAKSKVDNEVTAEDINNFFDDLKAKRRRLDEPPESDP